jgi:oligopeptide transport system substrate-binding protein
MRIRSSIKWLPIHSEAADVNRYKAGEIDIVYTVPINQFAQLKKTMGDQLNAPQLATYYYEFNTTRPPFNDPRVRLALNMALDKDIIAEKVLGQGQRPAWLISQPDIGGVKLQNPEYASWPREKRIAEAKKLLSEAGYSDSHPLVFNLLYNIGITPAHRDCRQFDVEEKPWRGGEAAKPGMEDDAGHHAHAQF